jgi:TonB family protein
MRINADRQLIRFLPLSTTMWLEEAASTARDWEFEMATLANKQATDAAETTNRGTAAKKRKLSAYLVTGDDGLWPQVAVHVGNDLVAKQLDSIDELLADTSPGQAGIVMWDARGHADPAAVLSRLQLHSARFAIVALDEAATASAWTLPLQHRRVVAMVSLPVNASDLIAALGSAHEEANARVALLGDGIAAPTSTATPTSGAATPTSATANRRRVPWIAAAACAAVLAAVAAYVLLRHDGAAVAPALAPVPAHPPVASSAAVATVKSTKAVVTTDDRVDTLIAKAQQAMVDRHFIDPVEGSALSLYREALSLNPASGEAGQGIQRVAEILFARAQSALDEHKLDVALQSLETVRGINPADGRLAALDERIASMRAELGPAQIQAAVAAQNFERATQLIDEAARAKSLPAAKLSQLRDEVRRRREEVDGTRFVALIEERLQQDRLIDPQHDNAAYYLNQARAGGASSSALQPQIQEFIKRGTLAIHGAIEQRRYGDAERLLTELRLNGALAATIASVQHDLAAARGQQAQQKSDQPQYLDLARARLAQGNVIEPDNDSALFYLNQLRTADPQNSGLAQLSAAVQAQILERARVALDAAQLAQTETLLQMASRLGFSTDLSALSERLLQAKLASAATSVAPSDVPETTLTRLNRLEPEYPRQAMSRNLEGWVELTYTVTPEGGVTQIKVFNSSPPGVFDSAAVQAIARLRYKPLLQAGKAVAVSTKIRVAFRVAR